MFFFVKKTTLYVLVDKNDKALEGHFKTCIWLFISCGFNI